MLETLSIIEQQTWNNKHLFIMTRFWYNPYVTGIRNL